LRTANATIEKLDINDRLKTAAQDGIQGAIEFQDSITFYNKKHGCKLDTPNIVAFSSLLQAIHSFAATYNSPPIAFVHDRQQEFKEAMQFVHEKFGRAILLGKEVGGMPTSPRIAPCDLARFFIEKSNDYPALQAVDLLLWSYQRRMPAFEGYFSIFDNRFTRFVISRQMSEEMVMDMIAETSGSDVPTEVDERSRNI
jgi:hypothetical protein